VPPKLSIRTSQNNGAPAKVTTYYNQSTNLPKNGFYKKFTKNKPITKYTNNLPLWLFLAKLSKQVADYTKELNNSRRINVLPLFDKEIAKDYKLVTITKEEHKERNKNTTEMYHHAHQHPR